MKQNKLYSLLLSAILLLSLLPSTVFAGETAAVNSAKVTLTAQSENAFLCAPQLNVTVSGDMAERYGFVDNVTNGVSALDALVKLHEIVFEDAFTREDAADYLVVSNGLVSTLFGVPTMANGFVVNGAYPHDGTASPSGGYNGTNVTTQAICDGDAVDFFIYQDISLWSDRLVWFKDGDTVMQSLSLTAGSQTELKLQGYSYMMGFLCQDANDMHKSGTPVIGAQPALIDAATGAVTSLGSALTDQNGAVTITAPSTVGTYYLTAYMPTGSTDAPVIMPLIQLTVSPSAQTPPTELSLAYSSDNVIDNVIYVAKGDSFQLLAYDENGNETPVEWKKTSGSAVTLNQTTGEVEVTKDIYGSSTVSLYFTATSTLDEKVSKRITVKISGYLLSEANKTKTVALSEDGQTAKTVTITGGKKGHTLWSWNIPQGIAEVVEEPGTNNSVQFKLFRPGSFDVTYKLDVNEALTDTATVTVTGVAVEDAAGNRAKTYLSVSDGSPLPQVQLSAFAAEGRTIAAWSSADETIATVDSNGLVSAVGAVGSTVITATDSEGIKGGIKLVVKSEDTPYFESLQFVSSAVQDYNKVYSFSPTVMDYSFNIKSYSVKTLTLQNTTLYDTEKYRAVAEYVDINGVPKRIDVNSGSTTGLEAVPFDTFKLDITIFDRNDVEKKTVYHFTVTRPRCDKNTIKSGGFVLVPSGRELLPTKYNGYAEGTMFKLTEDGDFKYASGTKLDINVSSSHYRYKCFVFSDSESVSLNMTGNTGYEHLRYSVDGISWKELPQGGGITEALSFGENETSLTVSVQILDDKTYVENVADGAEGFDGGELKAYSVEIERVSATSQSAQILTAENNCGDWYPTVFNSEEYTYTLVAEKGSQVALRYTVSPGAVVSLGTKQQQATDGVYSLALSTKQKQQLTVTSEDGTTSNTYSFKLQERGVGYPDKVVDFLCINSAYTNGIDNGNGASPWVSLSGTLTSLGNFGGYITYYYETPLTDDPHNRYGVDFYVYGNANPDLNSQTKTSFFEPAQAWVSEDGEEWYALAGSAHYDEGVDWNYSVTYQKTADGNTAWTDNHGNSHDGASYRGQYPSAAQYPMNELAKRDSIQLSGIALPAQNGNLAVIGESIDAYPVRWGYADCFVNGTKGEDVNPYQDNTNYDLKTNGFDLAWAVDKNGMPVDVSDKAFHYVKLVTASNIWHSLYRDKSAEISAVLRTKAQTEDMGTTAAPDTITLTDGAESRVVYLNEADQVYSVDVGTMKYLSVAVNGAAAEDNIYVNNTRITAGEAAEGFKITREAGERLIRVLIQNGDKAPRIYLLRVTGQATESDELIEGIKLDIGGSSRLATTTDGKTYTATVGYRINTVGIYPIFDSSVTVTVNGEAPAQSYPLSAGTNVFNITGEKDGVIQTVVLKIVKEPAPASTGKITVYFTLMGDEAHGDSGETHTLKHGGLTEWIPKTAIEVNAPATVLDVFEKALNGKYTFTNADGNYIAEIDGLYEFNNGSLSGWMYTLNGKHTNKGVAEQSVSNRDSIIFHYTDDYTQEQGSEKWASSGGSSTKSLTVRFETNGGSTIDSQSVQKNATAQKPADPTKAGFQFNGWYADSALTIPYDFTAKVTSSLTLYAAWKEAAPAERQLQFTIGRYEADVFGELQTTDAAPQLRQGRTMLPARFIAEALGATVEWDEAQRRVIITGQHLKTGETVQLILTVGSAQALLNNEAVQLDLAVFIEQDRTYTPLRFIAEALGATVEWIADTQTVIITTP